MDYKIEKTDFEILKFFIKNYAREFSIKEISDRLKRPYVKIHKSIKRLILKKIITEEIKGRSHYCRFDYKNNVDILCFINSLITRDFLTKNKLIKLLIANIKENITFPDYILLIFGSYAKGEETKESDIDICLIVNNENKEKAERIVKSIKGISNISIHSLEFSYSEFIDMLKSKSFNVAKEITKNNILLNGSEQFYNCINLSI